MRRTAFLAIAVLGLGFLGAARPAHAHAAYTEIDLSSVVNTTFANPPSWYINGDEFAALPGTTSTGNQGLNVPFTIAGTDGTANFWNGLYDGTQGDPRGSTPLSFTVPVNLSGVTAIYTLANNTFGTENADEYEITFTGVGSAITEQYVGGQNTRDYNENCGTTGCTTPAGVKPWFIDTAGAQRIDMQSFALPPGFGTLVSVTVTQESTSDGAIFAGLTIATPEPASWALLIVGLGGLLLVRYRRSAIG